MTLLLTEMTDTGVVFAADRNLSWIDPETGKVRGLACRRKKILGIEHLTGAIGYFGNSHVGRDKMLMDEWLEGFIRDNTDCESLEQFAHRLKADLENQLTPNQKGRMLGFHLAGYAEHEGLSLPTFWFVRNIKGLRGIFYDGTSETFAISEDFLQRDVSFVKLEFLHKYLQTHGSRVYHNGTLAPYVAVAEHVYSLFRTIWALREEWKLEGFRAPSSLEEHAALARFQIQLTASIYELFSKEETAPIGGGVDVITISPSGIVAHDYSES